MTKQEAEYLIGQMKQYLDDELSQIQERGKISFHAFERKYMEVLNGGAPLDVALFRLFLRECAAGYGTSNIEVVEETPKDPSNQTLYFFKNGDGYILKIYYGGEWIELYDKEELAKVAETGSYNDLINKPTIPSEANDATLTITRNNVEIGTFSANAKEDKSINISVPDGANNGKLTVKVGGVEKGSFTANQSTDTTIELDAATAPNNGKLTIKVDGTTKGTFTADQSTDTTIELTSGGGSGSATDRIRRVPNMVGLVAETDASVGTGEIVQYTGETTEKYVNGYFYKQKTIKVEYDAQFTGLKQLVGITDATLAMQGYTNMMLFFDETKINELVAFAKKYTTAEVDGSYKLAVTIEYDHTSFKTKDNSYNSEYNKICDGAKYCITYGQNDESIYFTREELENNYGFIIRNKGYIAGSQTQFYGDELTWQITLAKLDEQDQYTISEWLQHDVQPRDDAQESQSTETEKSVYQCARVTASEWEELIAKNQSIKYIVTSTDGDTLYQYNDSTGEWESITPDGTALYSVQSEGKIYFFDGTKFVEYGQGTEGSATDNNAIHYVTATEVTELPKAEYPNQYCILNGDLWETELVNNHYNWVVSSKDVVDVENGIYYKNNDGALVDTEKSEDVNYINDLTGDVYAWNGTAFVVLTDVVVDDTIYVTYSNKVSFQTALNEKLAAVKTVGEYKLVSIYADNGKMTTYRLSITDEPNLMQYISNEDGYRYRTFDSYWSSWTVKEYSFTHEASYDIRTYQFATNTRYGEYIKDGYINLNIHAEWKWLMANSKNIVITLYRKRHHYNTTKWCAYREYLLSQCPVVSEKNKIVRLPFSCDDLMNMLFVVKNDDEENFSDLTPNLLNAFKYGCGYEGGDTSFTHSPLRVYKRGIPSHKLFMYGYLDGYTPDKLIGQCATTYFGLGLSIMHNNLGEKEYERMPMSILRLKATIKDIGGDKTLMYEVNEYTSKKI